MKLGLVLSGGGARGAFEAGVIGALQDAHVRPTILSGTSAGALNAAGLAAGLDADRLARLWTSLRDRDVYRQRQDWWRLPRPVGLLGGGNIARRLLSSVGWTWLWDAAPLRRTLVAALGGVRVPLVGDAVLVVSAVEVASGRLVRFSSADPPPHRRSDRFRTVAVDVDHLLASAAIPLLFRPARPGGGGLFWDGGVVANTPLAPALAFEPDAVIVVMTSELNDARPAPRSLAEAVSRVVLSAQRFGLETDLARAEEVNALCRTGQAPVGRKVVDLLVVGPGDSDLGDPLRFDGREAAALVALGRRVGADAVRRWRDEGRLP